MTDEARMSGLDDDQLTDRLATFWREAESRIAGLPVHNPALSVMATPPRRFGRFRFVVVVTPWCMNVVAIPEAGVRLPPDGALLRLELPAGDVDFVVASMNAGDQYGTASLFSPMDEFGDQISAESVALSALDELIGDTEPSESGSLSVSLDRRHLLGLGHGA